MDSEWSKIVKRFPEVNFLQSPEAGKMNEILGDKVIYSDFGGLGWGIMTVKNARRGRYLEIPCGPLIDWNDQKTVRIVLEEIKGIGKKEKCVFVRIRPQLINSPENLAILENLGLKKSPMHLAAEHTVMIDLTKPLDALISEMRRQTRYEVRRAEKLGIKIVKSNSEATFKEFYNAQAKTAKRQNFIPPSLKVLLAEREAFKDKIEIYKAETSEGEAIAYGLIIKNGLEGDYYEAASTDLNRKLPGAYILLWQVIQDLKTEGYGRFNLWGIAPAGQPNHRYAGVTTFKTGFPGEVTEFVPAHDLVLSKMRYLLDYIFETLRKKKRHL